MQDSITGPASAGNLYRHTYTYTLWRRGANRYRKRHRRGATWWWSRSHRIFTAACTLNAFRVKKGDMVKQGGYNRPEQPGPTTRRHPYACHIHYEIREDNGAAFGTSRGTTNFRLPCWAWLRPANGLSDQHPAPECPGITGRKDCHAVRAGDSPADPIGPGKRNLEEQLLLVEGK